MLRVFWIYLALATIVCGQLPGQRSKQNDESKTKKEGVQHVDQSTTVIPTNPEPKKDGQKKYANSRADYWKNAFNDPAQASNWILVGIGIGALVATAFTLRIISRQTDATEKAADAALLNAKALIASERPWFVPSIERPDKEFDLWKVTITNRGRTPGQLQSVSVDHRIVNSPENLPLPPQYSGIALLPNSLFFASGDSFPAREFPARIDAEQRFVDCFLPKEIWTQESETKIDFLLVYGRAIYRDMFDNDMLHETRWCYLFRPAQPFEDFVECGPNEYNGYRDYPKE